MSRELVSKVTDAVVGEMNEWLARPLDAVYPVVFIDALYIKIRDEQVSNRPIYVAFGVTVTGERTCWVCGLGTATRGPSSGPRS